MEQGKALSILSLRKSRNGQPLLESKFSTGIVAFRFFLNTKHSLEALFFSTESFNLTLYTFIILSSFLFFPSTHACLSSISTALLALMSRSVTPFRKNCRKHVISAFIFFICTNDALTPELASTTLNQNRRRTE